MILNIFVGLLCVATVSAGFFAWWIDNGGTFRKGNEKKEEKKVEGEKCDEKN